MAALLKEYGPMELRPTVLLIHTDLSPSVVGPLRRAVAAAGHGEIVELSELPPLVAEPGDGKLVWHLAPPLGPDQFVIVDERVGARLAHELLLLIRATEEGGRVATCVLLRPPSADAQVFAAWAAGFDVCLTQPADPEEVAHFAGRALAKLKAG
jgi:hypothetical protein